jgi:citrate lyase subunit beta/citryl-CoA lyase
MMRSMLFVPGNSAGMLLNADVHGADGLILDLEDAVAPGEKDAARRLVQGAVQTLGFPGATLIIRINPLGTPYAEEDIARMVLLKPHLLMPTKVASAEDVAAISTLVAQAEQKAGLPQNTVGLIPLLETAQGIEHALEIARSDPRVKALFLGAEDLSSDLQAVRSKEGAEIAYARGRIVMAARAAGIDVYDTPFTDVNDDDGLQQDAALARALGFTGKAAISPRHVAGINAAFTPSPGEISYAREVLAVIEEGERLGKGAVSLRGKMIDKPIVDRARKVLQTAVLLGLERGAL